VANLDVEIEWARIAGRRGFRDLRGPAREHAAALGTLLRAFARPGDRLETISPVDPARVIDCPPLPGPEILTGPDPEPLRDPERPRDIVAWGSSRRIGYGNPDAAALASDRATLHAHLHARGLHLPGSRVHSLVEPLRVHLAERPPGGRFSPSGARFPTWVVKGRWSAAGRERTFVPVGGPSEAVARGTTEAESLLARHGAVVVEPWLDRVGDLGLVARSSADLPTALPHHLDVDPRGGFAGIRIGPPPDARTPGDRGPRGWPPHEQDLLDRALDAVRTFLQSAKHAGPVGIDLFRYRDPHGGVHLHPVVEVNPRLTFGHVAHTLAERLAGPRATGSSRGTGSYRLRLSTSEAPSSPKREGLRAWPLLRSPDHTRVWAAFEELPAPRDPEGGVAG
jgi:hypothetical protein